ncbi:hypothetical protein TBLA_0D01935 [Henningerozyma blattae CBS 6284]|uniref:RAVE complex protein Rav1 C-terminal domain-containing protein n=1 Tax=Henningerozyma blattae (strain ATCC 34711 / CBS 6284 / DSM 70876 / NBRC 10599 / NRRL Y-10934 / UCD 77-7) TaxID=1071380 RepID=I2H2U9_HENB6|nr:hypothetical protein TBLA_0D01935 [Tetrapisispora blattae CBS 6284]CCH60701.1 hypothetical protein TBLA_0D01935 [Tetrapisispora blattae CBS 6284]
MVIRFQPGRPNSTAHAIDQAYWNSQNVLAYCSGNNLIILTGKYKKLQTIYHENDCTSVSINNTSGLIAVTVKNYAYIYQPLINYKNNISEWIFCCKFYHDDSKLNCINWGYNNNIVLGSDYLSFWDLTQQFSQVMKPILLWNKKLTKPVFYLTVSNDSKYIATIGKYDKNIKIWKKKYIETNKFCDEKNSNERNNDLTIDFILVILKQPHYVTKIRWRNHSHTEESTKTITSPDVSCRGVIPRSDIEKEKEESRQVLYSLCADNVLRIWDCYGLNYTTSIQLWGSVPLRNTDTFCLIIDSWLLQDCLAKNTKKECFTISNPDFVLTFSKDGEINIYNVDGLSHNPPRPIKIRNLRTKFFKKSIMHNVIDNYLYIPEVQPYDRALQEVSIIFHNVSSGVISHFSIDIFELFKTDTSGDHYNNQQLPHLHTAVNYHNRDTHNNSHRNYINFSPNASIMTKYNQIGRLRNLWSGHYKSIQRLIRSNKGDGLLSISRFTEAKVWRLQKAGEATYLWLRSSLNTQSPIKNALVLHRGKLLIVLLENGYFQAWDSSRDSSKLIAQLNIFDIDSNSKKGENNLPILITEIPYKLEPLVNSVNHHDHKNYHHDQGNVTIGSVMNNEEIPSEYYVMSLIYDNGSILAFKFNSECNSLDNEITNNNYEPRSEFIEISSSSLKLDNDKIYKICAIDQLHHGCHYNRSLISVLTVDGNIKMFSANIKEDQCISHKYSAEWEKVHEFQTNISKASLFKASSTGKFCIVDATGKTMTLWNVNWSLLEYSETFDSTIIDVAWTNTEQDQCIISIVFESYSLMYVQMRYDYATNNASYIPVAKTEIRNYTNHIIGDSIWLKYGNYVIAAGNQLYIKDKSLDLTDTFSSQSLGSREIISKDLITLTSVLNGPLPVYHPQFLIQAIYSKKLKLVREILLRLFLQLRSLHFNSKDIVHLDYMLGIEPYKFLIKDDKHYIPGKYPEPYDSFNSMVIESLTVLLTKVSLPYLTRHQQVTLVTVVEAVGKISKNEGILDFNGLRFILGTQLYSSHKTTQKSILMRDVTWALHSTNKEIIWSLIKHHCPDWQKSRSYRVAYWLPIDQLKEHFEKIAKIEYTSTTEKDPSNCALYYLALRKKQILVSLWRLSVGHPERGKILNFLQNDFSIDRWRKAALKNAYVLLSQHRYRESAIFFLLGNALKDCIDIIFKHLEDTDLAIGICRIYEGDNGPVLGQFLNSRILPLAVIQGDRWTTSFVYWKQLRRDVAIKALITQPISIEDNYKFVTNNQYIDKSFQLEDPALLVIYDYLRRKNVAYFLASMEIDLEIEYTLILRVLNILVRMGCELLATSMIKNWLFIRETENLSNLRQVPRRERANSGVELMTQVPTTPTAVIPSLFDKFDKNLKTRHVNTFSRSRTNSIDPTLRVKFRHSRVNSIDSTLEGTFRSQNISNLKNMLEPGAITLEYSNLLSKGIKNYEPQRSNCNTISSQVIIQPINFPCDKVKETAYISSQEPNKNSIEQLEGNFTYLKAEHIIPVKTSPHRDSTLNSLEIFNHASNTDPNISIIRPARDTIVGDIQPHSPPKNLLDEYIT